MEINDAQQRELIFAGTVQHSLDEKHRVTVPSRWRRAGETEFFAIPDPRQPFLILLTELEMQRMGAELDSLPGLDPMERRSFKRQFFSKAQLCPMDKQGRLVLPAALCGELSFKGEGVLVGGQGDAREHQRFADGVIRNGARSEQVLFRGALQLMVALGEEGQFHREGIALWFCIKARQEGILLELLQHQPTVPMLS